MKDINVKELKERLDKEEELFVIDVREEAEYEDFNIGAELIPLGQLPQVLEDLEDYKDLEIVVHCRSGARSAAAKEILAKAGFAKVRNLEGGMLEWQKQFA